MRYDEMKEYLNSPAGDMGRPNPLARPEVAASIARANEESPMTNAEARQMIADYQARAKAVRAGE